MSDKELNKCCGSNCGCGSEVEEKHEGCCGGSHEHNHEGCGCGDHDDHEHFVVDLEDEEGNVISCDVIDAFEYKEDEYVLVQNPADGSVYLFKSQGEEGELMVPSEEEFEAVTKYYEEELSNQ